MMSALTPPAFEKKIIAPEVLAEQLAAGQWARPIIFTNGVFDIVHRGHVSYLDQAAQLGKTLIVALNSDSSVRTLGKGPDRPLNALADRLAVLAALQSTTVVTWFDASTPLQLIEQLRPDVIVKGGDYDMETLEETAAVRSWGGEAVAIPIIHPRSTTALVSKIRQQAV